MGMSLHVVGFKPPNETWEKNKAVYDACIAAGVDVPQSVLEFFDHMPPDPLGVSQKVPTKEFTSAGREGFEISMADIPPEVASIRFFASW